MSWQVVIGLEVHVQLQTQSKIFSSSSTTFGAKANENASLIDLGFPGTLPVLNKEAVNQAIKFGLAVKAQIHPLSVFERKNYFYPDLPKGYQLSQLEHPIVMGGNIAAPLAKDPDNTVELTRAHLEEDAGKSTHFSHESGIDLNRAGTPLLEIVTEPCIHSIEEALSYLRHLHTLVQYLEICDGNMQEGSFRCDVNISVRKKGQAKLGTRTEIKNMNSFRFIEKALRYEIDRHIDVLESGGTIIQETLLYDDKKNQTKSMRSKVDANDYRYFPCPDLLPVKVTDETIKLINSTLPELPFEKLNRYHNELKLGLDDAKRLTQNHQMAMFFENVLEKSTGSAKLVANWILGEFSAYLNKSDLQLDNSLITAEKLAELISCIEKNTISSNIAKQVFHKMIESNLSALEIITKENLAQISNSDDLSALIDEVLTNNAPQVEQYLAGKEQLFGFFIGQLMKQTKGKADPKQLTQLLRSALNKKS